MTVLNQVRSSPRPDLNISGQVRSIPKPDMTWPVRNLSVQCIQNTSTADRALVRYFPGFWRIQLIFTRQFVPSVSNSVNSLHVKVKTFRNWNICYWAGLSEPRKDPKPGELWAKACLICIFVFNIRTKVITYVVIGNVTDKPTREVKR